MQESGPSLPKGTKVPNHIVIIPDGNRRWARSRRLTPMDGHQKGLEALIKTLRNARQWGIHTATVWGLSTENWMGRPKREYNFLMRLISKTVDEYLEEARREKIKLVHLGRKDRLPASLMKKISNAEEETKNNKNHVLNIGLDYGGQDELVRAVKKIVKEKIELSRIDEKLLDSYMDTANQLYPYPDLIIRTSGEQRTSGILLWQSHYAETYWENDHFPDFSEKKLREAILDYSRRRRRFGGNDAVEHLKFRPEVSAKLELAWWRLGNIPEGTRFRDFVVKHMAEQYGLSKTLAKSAAKHLTEAILSGNENKWGKAKTSLKMFYKLVKGELKLAFEPSLAASLRVKLWQDLKNTEKMEKPAGELEETATKLYAEVYRISLFQAAKLAHLRVMASVEKNLAQAGHGEHHWERAEDYLQKFYQALKERVA